MSASDRILSQRRDKLQELRQQGLDPFYNRFTPSHRVEEVLARYGALTAPELEQSGETFRLAGRLVLMREFGKATFCHLQD